MKNKRWIYLAIISAIIVLGLASRKHGDILPEFIAEYSGDTLWAAMVYCGIRFLFPSLSILKTIVISLLFSYCIEISQLYQADWANTVRNTTLGALIFGHGFLWSDMIIIIRCYRFRKDYYLPKEKPLEKKHCKPTLFTVLFPIII